MILQRVTQTLSALCGRILDQHDRTTAAIDEAFRDEAAELEKRLERAEEQAAAAWSTCAALQKAVEELREGTAADLLALDAAGAKALQGLYDRCEAENLRLEERIDTLEGHPGLL